MQGYITACIVGISEGRELVILARGNNIKKAVDVAEIFKRKLDNLKCSVEIGSVEFEDRFVSTIKIKIDGELR